MITPKIFNTTQNVSFFRVDWLYEEIIQLEEKEMDRVYALQDDMNERFAQLDQTDNYIMNELVSKVDWLYKDSMDRDYAFRDDMDYQ